MSGPPAPEPASAAERQPTVLRVVRGEPTSDELAALIAVLTTRAIATSAPRSRPRSAWNHPRRLVRRPVHDGPEGWHRSSLPR